MPSRWMKKCNLKIRTEALLCFAQEQAIITNCTKFQTDKGVDSPSCRMCGETDKTISDIINDSKLAQREYKDRLDNVAKMAN